MYERASNISLDRDNGVFLRGAFIRAVNAVSPRSIRSSFFAYEHVRILLRVSAVRKRTERQKSGQTSIYGLVLGHHVSSSALVVSCRISSSEVDLGQQSDRLRTAAEIWRKLIFETPLRISLLCFRFGEEIAGIALKTAASNKISSGPCTRYSHGFPADFYLLSFFADVRRGFPTLSRTS